MSPPAPVELFERQRRAFHADMNPPAADRDDRLARLAQMTREHAHDIVAAIAADFGHRSRHETQMTEIYVVQAAVGHTRRHLKRWMKARRVHTELHFRPGHSVLLRQPLGVVGVISPWNFPYMLAVAPAMAAVAAGNRVLVKPSEHSPRTSALLAEMVERRFAPEELAVVNGDAEVGRAFADLPFDHLLFTGSTAVGRLVAQAAARNLTPVTLELGGKSPVIVDASCDIGEAAERLAFGKLLNGGQSCIAPDYVLVQPGRVDALAAALTAAVARRYPTLAANPDYTAIIDARHRERLAGLLADARARGARIVEINPAGETFLPAAGKLAPCLVLDANDDMALMQEEIFGPLLPMVTVPDLDAAIEYVNRRPRPLALYWFGRDAAARDRVLAQTLSGGVTINDTLWHIAQEALPFGGVGASGHGAYHGEHGFLRFSKEKAVFMQSRLAGTALFRPPYGRLFERLLALLERLARL